MAALGCRTYRDASGPGPAGSNRETLQATSSRIGFSFVKMLVLIIRILVQHNRMECVVIEGDACVARSNRVSDERL